MTTDHAISVVNKVSYVYYKNPVQIVIYLYIWQCLLQIKKPILLFHFTFISFSFAHHCRPPPPFPDSITRQYNNDFSYLPQILVAVSPLCIRLQTILISLQIIVCWNVKYNPISEIVLIYFRDVFSYIRSGKSSGISSCWSRDLTTILN